MAINNESSRILIVVGTRPEAIKMAPLYMQLSSDARLRVQLCATGQHEALLDAALADFGITADFHLSLMEHGQSLGRLTARAIAEIDEVLSQTKPKVVLVHGDTTTTLAAAICAFYHQIPVGHVEAGLRTRDLSSPFPEEFNRQAVSRLATWSFAPTELAVKNLQAEGLVRDSIVLTGNTIVDSLELFLRDKNINLSEAVFDALERLLGFSPSSQKTILVTTHRRENLSGNIDNIFSAIAILASQYPEIKFVLPLHPNPTILETAQNTLSGYENVAIIDPLNYGAFVRLLSACLFVLTDSGGVQEEAVTLGVTVLVLRDTTERPEGREGGNLQVVGTTVESIVRACEILIEREWTNSKFEIVSNVYGDGMASRRIHSVIAEYIFGDPSFPNL